MLTIDRQPDGVVVVVTASGRLSDEDYKRFVPEFEGLAARAGGPLRMLVELVDFQGWEPRALWDELRFDAAHRDAFGRMAVVGDKAWQEWGTKLSKPFFAAEMRFFEPSRIDAARDWLAEHAA